MEGISKAKSCAEKYINYAFLSERRNNYSRKCKSNCFPADFISEFCKDEKELSAVLNELIKEGKIEIVVKKKKILFFPVILSSVG